MENFHNHQNPTTKKHGLQLRFKNAAIDPKNAAISYSHVYKCGFYCICRVYSRVFLNAAIGRLIATFFHLLQVETYCRVFYKTQLQTRFGLCLKRGYSLDLQLHFLKHGCRLIPIAAFFKTQLQTIFGMRLETPLKPLHFVLKCGYRFFFAKSIIPAQPIATLNRCNQLQPTDAFRFKF